MSSLLEPTSISVKEKKFKQKWIEAHQFLDDDISIEKIVNSLEELEESNLLYNDMVIVHSMTEFKPLFVSKNIEQILGYTQEEFIGMGSEAYFKIHAVDQPDFWENLMNWENEAKRKIPSDEYYRKGRGYYGGVSQLHKNGSKKRFLARREAISGKNFEVPKITLLYFEEMTHFFKGNEYWMLFQNFTDKGMHTKFYNKEKIHNNLATDRELEVLKLVAAGHSTKEISKLLFISTDTVSQHRKNVIKRTGARDISSVVHFCKVCEVI